MSLKMPHQNPTKMQIFGLLVTLKALRDILCSTTITITALLFSQSAFGNVDKVWTRIESIKEFERVYLEEAKVPVPKMVRRYYRINPLNNDVENFETEAIYNKKGALIEGVFVYLNTRFRGGANGFSLDYEVSVGRALSRRGTYWVDYAGGKVLTEFLYGTDSQGTFTVKRNGKKILERSLPVGQ